MAMETSKNGGELCAASSEDKQHFKKVNHLQDRAPQL